MVKTQLIHDRSQAGFTLVELAIVMIIIGLLIGGILKGQELIANAQITATSSQIKAIEAAMTTFRDSYDAVPGDIANPGARLPNCTAAPCNAVGSGNNRLAQTPAAVAADPSTAGEEATRFWTHLAAADLIGGLDYTSVALTWGAAVPAAEIGGGFTVGYAGAVADLVGAGAATMNSGHYLSLRSVAATAVAASNANAALRPTQAARLDRKLDDGIADAGSVLAAGAEAAGTGCFNGAVYIENLGTNECQLYARIQ